METKKSKPDEPFFYHRIFWDVAVDALDYEAKSTFIIQRVFERCDVEDIRMCRRYYGDTEIRQVLLSAKYLPVRRMYLASAVIHEPIENFRCCTERQPTGENLPY